ncbi:HD-GYP domain-containing protein [Moorella sp. ACPs]|uniref:HD-GYP domain-containing protein n=1 Tax=Neomoorella carbonis TaxID=3062783 RepID=UPI003247AA2C
MSVAPEVAGLLDRLRKHSMTTYQHSCNVGNLVCALAEGLGLHQEEVNIITLGGLLHDIGKTQVRAAILHKAARLTAPEWEVMRRHPEFGVQILAGNEKFGVLEPLVAYHHERWDGQGYYGLGGNDIPLGARIIALADAFDAMTSCRAYQYSKNLLDGIQELAAGAGKQFDPRLVQLFFDVMPAILKRNSRRAG